MRRRKRTEITIETHRRIEVRWPARQGDGGEAADDPTPSQEGLSSTRGAVMNFRAQSPKKRIDPA